MKTEIDKIMRCWKSIIQQVSFFKIQVIRNKMKYCGFPFLYFNLFPMMYEGNKQVVKKQKKVGGKAENQ